MTFSFLYEQSNTTLLKAIKSHLLISQPLIRYRDACDRTPWSYVPELYIKAGVSVDIPPDNDSDDLFDDEHAIATSIDDSEEESLSNLEDLQTTNHPASQDNLIRSL